MPRCRTLRLNPVRALGMQPRNDSAERTFVPHQASPGHARPAPPDSALHQIASDGSGVPPRLPLPLCLVGCLLFVGLGVLVPTVFLPHGKVFEGALEVARRRGEVTPELSTSL
jgi:hypothetical protein